LRRHRLVNHAEGNTRQLVVIDADNEPVQALLRALKHEGRNENIAATLLTLKKHVEGLP
jgi:hypothetical protein